jgi:hypothetical protein
MGAPVLERALALVKAKMTVDVATRTAMGRATRTHSWASATAIGTFDDSCRDDGRDVGCSSRVSPCHGAAGTGYCGFAHRGPGANGGNGGGAHGLEGPCSY